MLILIDCRNARLIACDSKRVSCSSCGGGHTCEAAGAYEWCVTPRVTLHITADYDPIIYAVVIIEDR